MKKFFFMMIVAGALVACDNSGSNDANKDTSANGTVDTSGGTITTPPVVTPDTVTGAAIDTTGGTVTVDTTKK